MKRLEYTPGDGSHFATVAELLARYEHARRAGEPAEVIGYAAALETAVTALLDAELAGWDGRISRRDMARAIGRSAHSTVADRIARYRRNTEEEPDEQ